MKIWRGTGIAAILTACFALLMVCSCDQTVQPQYSQVLTLRGSPYERGLQHGKALSGRIRSLYSTLMTNSLMPYLNREQTDVASVLVRYSAVSKEGKDSYFQTWQKDCQSTCTLNCTEKCGFSYLIMLESAINLKRFIPQPYLDEMQGIADGADLPFEKILILNTFFDTLLSFRSITYYIRQVQAPTLEGIHFEGVETDGQDNDGDGQTDEAGESDLTPFEPMPHATLAEVPTNARLVFLLHDIKLGIGTDKGDEPGVDPNTVRIRHNDTQYSYPLDKGTIEIQAVDEDPEALRVIFAPPGGFAPAAVSSIVVQAGDFNKIVNPPPEHARFMRDERVVFSTVGYGIPREQIPNEGLRDPNTQPPSIAFAARGSATVDGQPLLAHHYALLDSNTSHKHAVTFVHVPDQGFPFVTLGYAGLIWGFSGMNAEGLAWSFTNSDTLNNPMVKSFVDDLFDASLISSGVPIGIIGRDLMQNRRNVGEAVDILRQVRATFGWNVLVADAQGEQAAVELDSNIKQVDRSGAFVIGPDTTDAGNLDASGNPLASVNGDDLRIASHYVKNLNDLQTQVMIFDLRPQRYWTSFYYRSLRAHSILGGQILGKYGQLGAAGAIEVLRDPDLVDSRDSMMAAVYLPKSLQLQYAMGQVPATSGDFVTMDLVEAFKTTGGE